MLTTALMLLATQSLAAPIFDVSIVVNAAETSWRQEDVDAEEILSTVALDLPGRYQAEVALWYSATDDGRLLFEAEVVEVRRDLLGHERRTLISPPQFFSVPGTTTVVGMGTPFSQVRAASGKRQGIQYYEITVAHHL